VCTYVCVSVQEYDLFVLRVRALCVRVEVCRLFHPSSRLHYMSLSH